MPRCHLLLPRRSRGRGLQLKINHPPPHPPAPAAHRAHPSIPLGGVQQNETWREHHLAPTPALGGPTAPLGISTTPAGAESAPGWEEKSWVPLAAPAWVSAEAPRVLWGSHAAPAPAPLLPLAAGAEPAARAAGSPHSPGPEFLPLLPQAGWLQPCEAAGDPGELLLRFPNDVAASCAGTPRLLSFPFLVHCAGDRILSPLFHWQPPFRRLPLPKKQKKQHPTLSAAPLDLRRALCQGREQPCRSLLLLLASPCSSPSCCWLGAAEQEGEKETSSVGSPSLSSLTENTFFFYYYYCFPRNLKRS